MAASLLPGGRERQLRRRPVSLTLGWLSPHLGAFAQAHPEVELEVRLSDKPSDWVRAGVDVALRGRGPLEDLTLVAALLATSERSLVATPAF